MMLVLTAVLVLLGSPVALLAVRELRTPMRTYVRMDDLERALTSGDLPAAITAARGRPIDLSLALRFLPLVAADPDTYNAWACRWLLRWLSEAPQSTMDAAAEIAGALVDQPATGVFALRARRAGRPHGDPHAPARAIW